MQAPTAGSLGAASYCSCGADLRRATHWLPFAGHARAAVTHGRDDATALALSGHVIGLLGHDLVAARETFERALALSRESALTLFLGGIVLAYAGEAERAIDWAERGLRLSPVDRLAVAGHQAVAIGHFLRGRYEEAANAAVAPSCPIQASA